MRETTKAQFVSLQRSRALRELLLATIWAAGAAAILLLATWFWLRQGSEWVHSWRGLVWFSFQIVFILVNGAAMIVYGLKLRKAAGFRCASCGHDLFAFEVSAALRTDACSACKGKAFLEASHTS